MGRPWLAGPIRSFTTDMAGALFRIAGRDAHSGPADVASPRAIIPQVARMHSTKLTRAGMGVAPVSLPDLHRVRPRSAGWFTARPSSVRHRSDRPGSPGPD